jgi:hypothetical protein
MCKSINVQVIGNTIYKTLVRFIQLGLGVRVMMFNATSNNIPVISWRSVLLVEETGENHRPAASHWQRLLHNVVSHEQGLNS